MFPGNIGEGISSDADRKIKKKAIRITTPLIICSHQRQELNEFISLVPSSVSNIAIFNKLIVYLSNINTKIKILEKWKR